MLTPMVAGGVVFPGLFLLSKNTLQRLPQLRWEEADAVIVSARLVSSVQAVMASTAGYIVSTSCKHIIDDQHWLSSAYTQFAVPYFIYDIYAMFLCHWHKHQVKGHGGDEGGARAPGSIWAVARGYLHKEFLMVLHHAVMVLVCFPLSVVSRGAESQGLLSCSRQRRRSPGSPVVGSPRGRAGPGWRVPAEGFLSTRPAPNSERVWAQPGPGWIYPAVVPGSCGCRSLSLSFLGCNIRYRGSRAGWLEGYGDVMLAAWPLYTRGVQTFRAEPLQQWPQRREGGRPGRGQASSPCPPQVWRQGKGDFFLGCLLMAEVSTPFVCLGKILIQVRGGRRLCGPEGRAFQGPSGIL
ncbi:ceramide synthase isoform X2 [Mirounga angustirostris]|uniref:ceramide synthase isoform X2 n=1 Tax=Mirounga angustirostris TaxID=9716 RepID=UPI00313EF157